MGGTASSVRPASIAPLAPREGELIDGKYRVQALIGEGGMSTVVAAHHELLDIQVAVKLLSPSLLTNPRIVGRFLREARAAARLKSEHVARVMDVGQLPDGQPYIVMELLDGEDLEQRIARVGALPIDQAVDFTLQALEAMAHAHARQIVHRDIKPANLFVTQTADGRDAIKVLDFGIAKLADLADDAPPPPSSRAPDSGARIGKLTAENQVLGSPIYMAPEQVRMLHDIDARVDIWAIGAILYEMLTGRTAFGGEGLGEIFAGILGRDPPPITDVRPEVPEALVAAVARCLRRDREERFRDVGELAEAIAPFASFDHQPLPDRIESTLEHITELTNPGHSDPGRSLRRLVVPTPSVGFRPVRTPQRAFSVTKRRQMAEAQTQLVAKEPALVGPRQHMSGGVVLVVALVLLVLGDYRVDTTSTRAWPHAVQAVPAAAAPPAPASSVAALTPSEPAHPPAAPAAAAPSHVAKTAHPRRKSHH
jgi:eukaryotic-like serine/threonine-protein kinase